MKSLPDPNADEKKKEKTGKDPEGRMTFTQHLGELRARLVRSGIAIAIGFVLCYWQADKIVPLLMKPLTDPSMLDWFDVVPEKFSDTFFGGGDEEANGDSAGDEEANGDSAGDEAAEEPGAAEAEEDLDDPENPEAEEDLDDPETPEAEGVDLVVLNPIEAVLVYLKISAFGGILLALPVLLFELSGFIFPGLTRRERTMVRILVIGCTALSMTGVVIAYFIIFPLVMPYLMDFAPEGTIVQLRMNETTSLLLKGFAGFGIAFQFPMAVFILVYMGLLTPAILKQYRRVAVVGMLVASMMLTPPDPLSMIMMAGPLILLYEGSIWVSYLVLFSRRKKQAADDNPDPTEG